MTGRLLRSLVVALSLMAGIESNSAERLLLSPKSGPGPSEVNPIDGMKPVVPDTACSGFWLSYDTGAEASYLGGLEDTDTILVWFESPVECHLMSILVDLYTEGDFDLFAADAPDSIDWLDGYEEYHGGANPGPSPVGALFYDSAGIYNPGYGWRVLEVATHPYVGTDVFVGGYVLRSGGAPQPIVDVGISKPPEGYHTLMSRIPEGGYPEWYGWYSSWHHVYIRACVSLPFHDGGVVSIASPPETVIAGSTYPVVASVRNFGTFPETFDVVATTDGYADTVQVTALPPGLITQRTFDAWSVPVTDSITYMFRVCTRVQGDVDSTNDCYQKSIFARGVVYDCGVISVGPPPDTVLTDSIYSVEAAVQNFGNIIASLDVIASLDGYTDTVQIADLLPDSTYRVSFRDWQAPPGDSTTYTMTVCTYLPDDVDTSNNCAQKRILACNPVHDGAAVSIDAPDDTVFCDSIYPVRATVSNLGNISETFDVVALLDGYTDTTQVLGLAPDSAVQVIFDDWLVPSGDSAIHILSVCTHVPDDRDTCNDCTRKDIFAHNPVGVEEGLTHPRAPEDFTLGQCVPNPLTDRSAIFYSLPLACHVALEIRNITGRLVETLVNETQEPGMHQVRWDRKNNPSGVYFYRLKAGDCVETRKMVVVE